MKHTTLFVTLLVAAYASAHGYVAKFDNIMKGTSYKGNNPYNIGKPISSAIRKISKPDPTYFKDVGKNIACGPGAKPGADIADPDAGDELDFDWREMPDKPWPHSTGPLLTYMASCGKDSCKDFDPKEAMWFKISQHGATKNGSNVWVQADLMAGKPHRVKIPANLAPGNYIIRTEIIALHLYQSAGPEFYPSCAQLKVGGNGNGHPAEADLVKLPDAYLRDEDAGIFKQNPYNNVTGYSFPGPQIAHLTGGGDDGDAGPVPDDDTPGSPDSTSSTDDEDSPSPVTNKKLNVHLGVPNSPSSSPQSKESPAPTPLPSAKPKSGKCKAKTQSNSQDDYRRDLGSVRSPRLASRVMRDLSAFESTQ